MKPDDLGTIGCIYREGNEAERFKRPPVTVQLGCPRTPSLCGLAPPPRPASSGYFLLCVGEAAEFISVSCQSAGSLRARGSLPSCRTLVPDTEWVLREDLLSE